MVENQSFRVGKPDVVWLTDKYREVETDLNDYRQLMAKNAQTRFCEWENQSDDGRKYGDDAFPWEGASDLKLPQADNLINVNVAILTEALHRANIQAVPVESNDISRAALVGNYMRWRIFSQMPEFPAEAELGANYHEEKGSLVMGVYWEQGENKHNERVTVDDLVQKLVMQGVMVDAEIILDPQFQSDLVTYLRATYPALPENKEDQVVKELRSQGSTILPVVNQVVNRPALRAFRLGIDVMYPRSATCLQTAPYVFRSEYKTPQQLLGYVNSDGWDEKWVNAVIEKCIGSYGTGSEIEKYYLDQNRRGLQETEDRKGLIHVVTVHQRLVDEDGVSGIYETVFCPDLETMQGKQMYAKTGLQEYHLKGRYPYWEFDRENISRRSHQSRGVPDVARDFQRIEKTMWDGEIDNTSLRLSPPLEYIIGRPIPERGPGAMVPVARRGEFGYGDIPDYIPADRQMREMVRDLSRDYFGLNTTEEHSAEARAKKQSLINRWLRNWSEVFKMVFWLDQQFADPVTIFRVMGSNTISPMEFVKNPGEEVDFYITFDVLSQEPELQEKKIKNLIELFSAADRNARANWDELLKVGAEFIDPVLAERLIKPEDAAMQDEVKEELELIQKMWAGFDIDLPEQGVNTQLRRQVLQSWMSGTENIPATDVQQRLQTDEAFKMRIEKHISQLDFIDQQRTNAVTGRLGTPPGNINVA